MKVRSVSLEQLLKQLENSRMSSDLGKDIRGSIRYSRIPARFPQMKSEAGSTCSFRSSAGKQRVSLAMHWRKHEAEASCRNDLRY